MTRRAKHIHESGCGANGPSGQLEPCTCEIGIRLTHSKSGKLCTYILPLDGVEALVE